MAQENGGIIWQYSFDGNGSLVEMTPGTQAASGAKRYHYNPAGQLTQVETHDGSAYQPQAAMAYNGQGQRLALTAYEAGQSLTSHYLLEGERVLAATANGQTSYYLQGIGEYQAGWRYYLPDGAGSARQLSDAQGQVTGTRSFTPWGELLAASGQSELTSGYLGGLLDAATGLIYVGNGQYYDPVTGRFLTRGAQPSQPNPYVPWSSDPLGSMLAPLALLAMLYGRKKQRGKWNNLMIVFVLSVSVAMGVAACGNSTTTATITVAPTATPTPTSTVTVTVDGATYTTSTPTPAASPMGTLTVTCDFMLTRPLLTLFFGGSDGSSSWWLNPGPDPSIQTPVWTEIATEVVPYTPPNKAAQANSVNIDTYKDANLRIIGYSAGGDTALIFADKYRRYQLENNGQGKITGVVVLGGTFSGQMTNGRNLATEWRPLLDDLLIWGTNVYVLDDRGCGGGEANSYSAPPNAIGIFHAEVRTISGNDCDIEQKKIDPTGQEHWDGGLSGQVGVGTNNSKIFRDEVLDWFDQQCK